MNPLINVGASKEGVEAASVAIHHILDSEKSDQVTLAAIKALSKLCEVKNTSISNNTFTITQ